MILQNDKRKLNIKRQMYFQELVSLCIFKNLFRLFRPNNTQEKQNTECSVLKTAFDLYYMSLPNCYFD